MIELAAAQHEDQQLDDARLNVIIVSWMGETQHLG
jgi:hypothetical protein